MVFDGHIAQETLILTDGLRSYNVFSGIPGCSVLDVNVEEKDGFLNLNTVNSLHSFIKETYKQYRGVATKYLNRYNALFSVMFRAAKGLTNSLFNIFATTGNTVCPHTCSDVREYNLLSL